MKLKAQDYIYYVPESARKILLELKNNYPLYSGNKDGSISKILTGLSVTKGAVAPPFSLVSLDGKTISLADLKGKYVFIDFWGSWCGPCRGEIPNIKKMSEEIPESKLVVIGLICHDNEKSYKKFLTENGINYQNAVSTQEIMDKYGIRSWPTTFLINPEGIIIEKDLRGEGLSEQVKRLME
jgi:thiol-disulfide isomerase/thioredoxin